MKKYHRLHSKEVEEFVVNQITKGETYKEIYQKLSTNNDYDFSYDSFTRFALRLKKKYGVIDNGNKIKEIDERIIKLLEYDKIIKISTLLSKLNCKKKELESSIINCQRNGYEIILDGDIVLLSNTNTRDSKNLSTLGSSDIIFGIVSDPHFGSKSCQLTALNEFSDIMRKKGVQHVFVPGDLVSGYDVYPGQIHDVYAITAKEQEDTTLRNLPLGFNWYVLGGNHCYSFVKKAGYNIISSIANKRSDVHYLGFDVASIPILKNVDLMLVHPSGGVPYSISYRLQKNIEQITISELQNVVRGVKDKPSIRFVLLGHLHIQMQAMFGSIWGAQCGTFEGQTNYLKRKGLIPSIGGWIVKATLGRNGLLKNFEAKFYIFDEIENDWKNYEHTIPEEKIISPIFE